MNIPFTIQYFEDPQTRRREIHLSFTPEFQFMEQPQRVQVYKSYIEYLIAKAQQSQDETEQKGVITILQIAEQLFSHIQADQIPLHETLVVEMGENAEGSSLDELLQDQ